MSLENKAHTDVVLAIDDDEEDDEEEDDDLYTNPEAAFYAAKRAYLSRVVVEADIPKPSESSDSSSSV
jgi:hypothetical protein